MQRLRKSDFILESKMAELNKKKKSKQPVKNFFDWMFPMKKIYSTISIENLQRKLSMLFSAMFSVHCFRPE